MENQQNNPGHPMDQKNPGAPTQGERIIQPLDPQLSENKPALIRTAAQEQEALGQEQAQNPVVSAPQSPSTPPTTAQPAIDPIAQALADPNSQVPLGMAASQLGLNQVSEGRSRASMIKLAIILFVAVILIFMGYSVTKALSGNVTKDVQANGLSYSVTFTKISKQTTVDGKTFLQGADKSGNAMLLSVGKSTKSNYDCRSNGSVEVKVLASPEVEGQKHNLCYSSSLNVYDMNFTHDGTWYFITVFPKDKTKQLDQANVKSIIESVQIKS